MYYAYKKAGKTDEEIKKLIDKVVKNVKFVRRILDLSPNHQ